MRSHVLKLPRTKEGRAYLLECIRDAGGWDLPDESNAADHDWDQLVIDIRRDNEAFEQWYAERHGKK